MHTLLRSLRLVDAVVILFAFILSILLLIFGGRQTTSLLVVGMNVVGSLALLVLSSSVAHRSNRVLSFIHDWYPVPMIFLMFKEVYVVIQTAGMSDWDDLLIAADHLIFGVHPTQWLQQFSFPLLTELLQVAYASYYFIMLAVGVEVFVRQGREQFTYVLFLIVYGFFLSYIGYIFFPAVGPRFTLHDFHSIDTELPGLFLTTPIRDFLNAGESIPRGAVQALALAQRDAFPSGHTEMTLISLYLAHRYHLRARYVLYVFGTLLIISTVYLRYHYVIDLVGGLVFMVFTVWSGPRLAAWWDQRRR